MANVYVTQPMCVSEGSQSELVTGKDRTRARGGARRFQSSFRWRVNRVNDGQKTLDSSKAGSGIYALGDTDYKQILFGAG